MCSAAVSYEEKVDRRGRHECWGWSGFKHKGYGRLRLGRQIIGAHRLSYLLHKGEIASGLAVLHLCDNPECTNPAHLFLGTSADNNADRNLKERQAVGENCATSRLSEEAVRDLRANLVRGQYGQVTTYARKYGVARNAIYAVLNAESWRHIA